MTCPNCGSPNEPGRKFWGECDTRLSRLDCGTNDLGLEMDEPWVTMAAAAVLGADDPEIAGWVDHAKLGLEHVGAAALVAQLERHVAQHTGSASSPATGQLAARPAST